MKKPELTEFNSYHQKYIDLVDDDLVNFLIKQQKHFNEVILSIPESKGDFQYAEGKWSIKGLVSHINDTERIFAYRALTFARGDQSELPGYDENNYVSSFNPNLITFENYLAEFNGLRMSTIALCNSITEEMGARTGFANGNILSARAALYITGGHLAHHISILMSRYLK